MSIIHPYIGNDPMLELRVKDSKNHWIRFLAYVDSGAFMTILTRNDAHDLGIELEKGRGLNLYGVGGVVAAYIHKVEMKISEEILNTEIAFSFSNETPRLIGRQGIFNHFVVCFNDKTRQVFFK